VCGGLDAMAVRVPAHPVALALLRAVRRPVAAPSANRSNELSPTTAQHVLRALDGRIDMVLDGGPCSVGLESTVLDLCGETPVILRPGRVTLDELAPFAPGVTLRADTMAHGAPRPSPGMDAKHYAPRARLVLVDRAELPSQRTTLDGPLGVITVGPAPRCAPGAIVRALPADPHGYGAMLYESLHALDLAGCAVIACERVPDGAPWDAARDRLRRASA
jgi:L-threonylcarbamoyladenylate synthase